MPNHKRHRQFHTSESGLTNLSCLCNSLSFPFIRFLRQVDVPIEVPEEIDDMSATVHDEDGKLVRSTLNLEPDGLYHVR